ncbi:MAG TPA: CBS domain-containing protein [Ferruginibacter sp.]|jgi:CBS domain-containing protein|nr:CBS domain-containing protein [Ferruginibacter sp.]MBN8701225.1 CBS domain-containing protein [Chitinophagales bacterium]HMW27443.1 CBS domain-containing protein [Ferruginibacter sp.]HMX80879.1 CBS domain-containing protein [Ferruginibacter sp.]HNL65914.1 CBS domain-containing protein [Ferruginibacter sp.]
MKVADILQAKGNIIYSVTGSTTVYEAIKVMGEKNIGALLVLEGGKLTGILSERDYARKVVLKGKASRETSVSDIMTAEVITVMPSDTIETCMELMTQKHIRHLPIVESGNVLGMISIGDVVNAIIRMQKETIEHLKSYIAQ